MTRRAALGIVLLAGLAANLGTLGNGFAYDDLPVIEANLRLHHWRAPWAWWTEGFWPATYGAANWRPWTAFAFNLQWLLGGGSPVAFHLVNLLLLLGCSAVLFSIVEVAAAPWAAAVAAALFAVHPVHVEAVGNGVGQAELWMTLASLAAVRHWLRQPLSAARPGAPWALLGWFALAASAKEQGFVLPLLLVVVEWARGGDWSAARRRGVLRSLLWMAGVGAALLTLRSVVLGGLGVPSVAAGLAGARLDQRLAIAVTMAVEAGRLLLWPASLAIEYGPPEFDAALGWTARAWLGVVMLAAVLGSVIAARHRAPWATAGVVWCLLAWLPASNLLAPTGILLAERTLMLPSAGLALVTGALVVRATGVAAQRAVVAAALVLCVLGIARSGSRHRVWRDNATLFAQAVRDRPRSYRAHALLATDRLARHDTLGALASYERAVGLWPRDPRMLEEAAQLWRALGRCDRAVPLLAQALRVEADRPIAAARLAACATDRGATPP